MTQLNMDDPARSGLLLRIPVAMVLGTMAFWVGFARLVTMSSGLTVAVIKGDHPKDAVSRLNRERHIGQA